MRHRNSGYCAIGTRLASWAQYSNSSPACVASAMSVARVDAQPGEQRELLAAHQDVDRIDLDETHAIEHPAQVPTVDPTGGPRFGEALGPQRDPPGLGDGQGDGHSAVAAIAGQPKRLGGSSAAAMAALGGAIRPRCAHAVGVTTRPRGVRMSRPWVMRNGS